MPITLQYDTGGLTFQYDSLPSRPTWTLVAPSTNGLPTVSTAQVKWGTTSASFDGTAKGIAFTGSTSATTAVNAGGLIPTGTGMSFTLEMWIYIPTANLGTQRAIYDAGQGGVGIGIRNTNVLYFGQAGVSFGVQTSTAIAGNTWTHIAFMISGSTNYIFINGVATSGATSNYSFTNPQGGVVAPAVGINGYGDRFIGFMQDIRISNGAIYATGGFTPPAAPLTNTAQTVLLIPCYDGTIADTPGTTAGGITLQYEPGVIATGGTITDVTIGNVNYRVHTFTSTGSFIVTNGGPLDYFIVAGGGGGGRGSGGNHGGGGAGGLLTASTTVTPQTYTVTVGAGGTFNAQGANSSFAGQTAVGGGFGGTGGGTFNGGAGGSGGGGGATSPTPLGLGGAGTAGQGNAGGNAALSISFSCGGGGGAGAVGGNAVASGVGAGAGSGGVGIQSSFNGTATYYAGGGGGAAGNFGGAVVGVGGLGGGGAGAYAANTFPGTSGTTNTGGGGGGGTFNQTTTSGLPGGSGIVMIRYIL